MTFQVSFEARVKEKLRTRFFGNCFDPTSSTHYDVKANVETDGNVIITYSNEATVDEDKNYIYVTIQPIISIDTQLYDLDLDLWVSGRNNLAMFIHSGVNFANNFMTGLDFIGPLARAIILDDPD